MNNPAFNSVDASLWFFWAVQHYFENGGNDGWERYGEAAKSVLNAYQERSGIKYPDERQWT